MRVILEGLVETACVVLAVLWAGLAPAQSYPAKPIRVIIGYSAGGPTDVLGRIVAQKISANIGQTMLVENRPGANSIIGTELVANAPRDGYTIILASIGHTVNPSFYSKVAYDPIKDFSPITLLVTLPLVMIVNPSLPVKTMRDLVALANARPGQLSFGSAGNGSSPHLAGELLKTMAKIDMVHVPYKGNGPALADVMAGQIPLMLYPVIGVAQNVKAGTIRALAIGAKQRLDDLPDVPTMAESGFPGFEESAPWVGYLAPAGTSAEVVDKLHTEIIRTLSDSEVKDRIKTLGAVMVGNTPAEFATFLKADLLKWAKVIKDSGAKAN
jgi:tripartite-type tricarboxylate transporter receptor subunit TctC